MKKWIAFCVVLCMLLMLAACGSVADLESAVNDLESAADNLEPVVDQDLFEKEEVRQPDFPETVIVDNENCTVKIIGIDANNVWGYTLKVFLENKTDLNLMFSLDKVSVNDYMCDPFWATTVTAGMKSNEEVSFSSDDFEEIGITDVTDITFQLRVYDSDNWDAEDLVNDMFTIYPLGEDADQEYHREVQPEDLVLFDTDTCAMIVTGYEPDNLWGYTVKVFLVNKTEHALMFSVDDAAVNGFMCDPFWAKEVAAEKMSYAEISWAEESFEENGITEVEILTLPISVYDNENWEVDHYIDETFEVKP